MRRIFVWATLLFWIGGCRPEIAEEQRRHQAVEDSVRVMDQRLAQYLYDSLAGRPLPARANDSLIRPDLTGLMALPYVVALPPVPGQATTDPSPPVSATPTPRPLPAPTPAVEASRPVRRDTPAATPPRQTAPRPSAVDTSTSLPVIPAPKIDSLSAPAIIPTRDSVVAPLPPVTPPDTTG
jgi:hypothetical protein